ncbi:MAG: response regulator [Thermodesulfobacteriota bacterium]
MSEKTKAIILVSLLITLLTGLFLYEGVSFFTRDIQQQIRVTEAEIHATTAGLQEFSYQPYVKRIKNLLLVKPQIPAAFATGDRQRLHEEALPIYRALIEENPAFYVMHFHRPDNTSLLRMHWPDYFDDDLSQVRPMVVATNQDHKPRQGYEMGRHGPFYRVVHPVFYQERYIGAMEFGIRAHQVLEILQKALNSPATSYFSSSNLAQATRIQHSPVREVGGGYSLFTHNQALFEQLPKSFSPVAKDNEVEIGHKRYMVHALPIFRDYQDQAIGGIMVMQDITPLLAKEKAFIQRFIALSLLLIGSVVAVLFLTFGQLMKAMAREVERRQESEERYRQLFEQMPSGALLLQPAGAAGSYLIKAGNDAALAIEEPHQLSDRPLESLFPPDQCGDLHILLQDAAQSNTARTVPPFQRHQGKLICQGAVYPLASGEMVFLYEDISQKSAMEKERRQLETRLQRAQKMEAIGLLAGGVAHDLNNILSGLVSYPELLLLQLPEESSMRQPLETIQQSGQRAAAVVADLLTVARGVATSKEAANINEIIDHYRNSLEGRKLRNRFPQVELSTELAADLPPISCSIIHIEKVVMNLITNSFEASEGIGMVTIRTASRELPADFCADQTNEAGEYVCLEIHDNGPGIAAEDLDHIFEPFYSRKAIGRSGTGLGLAVVWSTIHEHDGLVQVLSTEEGTAFRLFFPALAMAPLQPEDKAALADELPKGSGQLILLVDDEQQQRDITSHMLIALGYRVEAAASGEEALELCRKKEYDLLLLDMLMGRGMNGGETFLAIRQERPKQQALILSGYSQSAEVDQALAAGAAGFLKKPVTLAQLGQGLAEVFSP